MSMLVVTGASRGIGAATARLAAARGWAVAVNYMNDRDAALGVVRAIEAAGGRAAALRADIAREDQAVRLFEEAERALGPLGGLVNNAGILAPLARVEEMDAARIERQFAVNVTGAIVCAREAVRRLSTRRGGPGGVIVNVSSGAARLGAAGDYVDYAATKGALDTFTLGLAREVAAEGIRVNAVRPGFIDTDIHRATRGADGLAALAASVPMQRAGRADEVAEAIVWLLSPAASYVAGAFLDVTGGR